MEIDQETVEAIKQELGLFRFAMEHFPDEPVGSIKACGCMGPLPECRCAKRERLVRSFLDPITP